MDAYFLLAVFLSFAVVSCENHDTGKLVITFVDNKMFFMVLIHMKI